MKRGTDALFERFEKKGVREVWSFALVVALLSAPASAESACLGTTSNGRLEGACQLPSDGSNFEPYSEKGVALGRTFLHCTVAEIVFEAYSAVSKSSHAARFVYGETGLRSGGDFSPHKTHQNGLSVDFFVPVRDASDRPTTIPATESNRWGYDVEFTPQGKLGELTIDFEAMASHLLALTDAAAARGVGIARVYFDPALQKRLETTAAWPRIRHLPFSTKQGWWRHDEHYHVDFELPCRPLP
jgi:penicillin-insensitive murein endopeptidase